MLIALMTENFKNSDWTSQEIGFALGRKKPILSINMGMEPYGFIKKYQAIDSTWDTVFRDIKDNLFKYFLKEQKVLDTYIKLMKNCNNYGIGNNISKYLPSLTTLSESQVVKIIEIFNSNDQLQGSFGFNGEDDSYGKGLVYHLNRVLKDNIYRLDDNYEISKVD